MKNIKQPKNNSKKTILLTGATGYLGSNLLKLLINKECKLYIPHVKLWFYDINPSIITNINCAKFLDHPFHVLLIYLQFPLLR